MERKKCLLTIVLMLTLRLNAQSAYKSIIYNAYVNSNMDLWKQTIDKIMSQPNKTPEATLELINYQYGYVAWCIGNNKHSEALKYINITRKKLDYLEKLNYKLSCVSAYKSAFYGFEIAISWYKAVLIGPKSLSLAETAIKLDKNNPIAHIQYANIKNYVPVSLIGSKTEAIKHYKIAQNLMEKNPNRWKNDWNYLNLLITIAQTYTEIEDYKSAKEYYEKILRLEPDFHWVKNELYPKILKLTRK